MQPYRLEMGTLLCHKAGKDLYAFWGETPLDAINAELDAMPRRWWSIWPPRSISRQRSAASSRGTVIQPVFEDWKNGKYKIISFTPSGRAA